jgi:hypothetical protein
MSSMRTVTLLDRIPASFLDSVFCVMRNSLSFVARSVCGIFGEVFGSVCGVFDQVLGSVCGIFDQVLGSVRSIFGEVFGSVCGIFGQVLGCAAISLGRADQGFGGVLVLLCVVRHRSLQFGEIEALESFSHHHFSRDDGCAKAPTIRECQLRDLACLAKAY